MTAFGVVGANCPVLRHTTGDSGAQVEPIVPAGERVAGHAPWITIRLPGAPPASAGSRYTSQACSRREGNGGCVKITRILGVPDTGGPNTHIDWRRSQPSHPKRPQGHFKAN